MKKSVMFVNPNATDNQISELMSSVEFCGYTMYIQLDNKAIDTINKKLDKDDITPEEVAALKAQLKAAEDQLEEDSKAAEALRSVANKVIDSIASQTLTKKDGTVVRNNREAVINVLRLFAVPECGKFASLAISGNVSKEFIDDMDFLCLSVDSLGVNGVVKRSPEVTARVTRSATYVKRELKSLVSIEVPSPYLQRISTAITDECIRDIRNTWVSSVSARYSINKKTEVASFKEKKYSTAVRVKGESVDASRLFKVLAVNSAEAWAVTLSRKQAEKKSGKKTSKKNA